MRLAQRMGRVAPSATMAAKQAAADLQARGVDVVDFGPGEPDFETPAHVVEAAKKSLDRGETHYSSGAGLPELRAALAGDLGRRVAAPGTFDPDHFIVTCGGKSALLYLMLALLDEGDEVIVPAPCWVSFPDQARLAGGVPVLVPGRVEDGLRPRMSDLQAAVTPRTRAVIINSPSNPTGAILGEDLLLGLADLVRAHDLILISDETYVDFSYDPSRPAVSTATLREAFGERLVVVNSFSKTFAMTGWRVGWAWFADAELRRAVLTLQSQDTTHPATFAQRAACVAIESSQDCVRAMRDEYASRRQIVMQEMATVPGMSCSPPDGAFYLFPDVREAMRMADCADDQALALRLLCEAHVAVVAGTPFHGPGHVRISYAVAPERIREGIGRMRRWLQAMERAG